MKMRRLRNRHGEFLRKLMPTPAAEACWLIWSRRYRMWHRAELGTYTSDVTQAGVFTIGRALALHDGIHNEAFHVSEKIDLIDLQAADARRMLGQFEYRQVAA